MQGRDAERHLATTQTEPERGAPTPDIAFGPILPAVAALETAVEAHVMALAESLSPSDRAMAFRERAATAGDVSPRLLGGAREDLDHARERGDAVERALGPFDHLDAFDVV